MKAIPIIVAASYSGSIPATLEQLAALGVTPAEIEAGEKRFEMETFGVWNAVSSVTAPVMRSTWSENRRTSAAIFPPRKAYSVKSSGYELEGRISLGGCRFAVFTSSVLFELPDGRLIECAVLHTANRGKLQS
jgi:hypothetical protein